MLKRASAAPMCPRGDDMRGKQAYGWVGRGAALGLLALSLSVGSAQAQDPPPREETRDAVIRGQVVDRTGAPVPAALVGIALSDQAVMADTAGRFFLPVGRPGRYRIAVEQLGYAPAEVWVEPEDIDRPIVIAIERDPILLEGLEVTVDRMERRRRFYPGLVRVVSQDDLALSAANTAYDVLRRYVSNLRPCVNDVRSDCILRRGTVQPLVVCLDERPAWGGRDELETYTAEELYLVEVYDMGRAVRMYTRWYMDTMMKRPKALVPIEFGC